MPRLIFAQDSTAIFLNFTNKPKIMQDSLTDQQYWETYYQKASTQKETVMKIGDSFSAIWDIWMKSCRKKPETVIEIGAYPGRYIGYFGRKFGLKPTGLDFNSDRSKIEETMKVMEVDNYEYIQADLFKHEPDKKYDLVFSNGFIEHFDDYQKVLDKHLDYLSPEGSLLIMIPNKRYLRKWYGMLLDRKNLRIHNLNCMNFDTFETFAKKNNLKIEYLKYSGGFGYPVHEPLNNIFKRVLYGLVSRIFKKLNPWLERHPSKYWSTLIICVCTPQREDNLNAKVGTTW